MRQTFITTMPDHVGAFLQASRAMAQLGLNITRVSYNRAIDVHTLFIEAEGEEDALARAVEVELELRLQPGCLIAATEDELYQIAFNLMENAVKYNLPGGTVIVTLFTEGDTVCLRVEDTGVGIPEDAAAHVFERFYRVDKARSRESGGTGLGLSIAREIVLRHHGTIALSDHSGPGTTVRIVLPIHQAEEQGHA